jgi:hypothetical protein
LDEEYFNNICMECGPLNNVISVKEIIRKCIRFIEKFRKNLAKINKNIVFL